MQRLVALFRGLAIEDDGQDLLEYGLLIVLIAVVCIGAVTFAGQQINNVMWTYIVNTF